MSTMKYSEIPHVSKPVSRILYGTAASPFLEGGDGTQLLDAMLEMGVTTIDTARKYDSAEISIGNWMEKRNNRDQVVLLSKCGHPSDTWENRVNEKEIRADLTCSLNYLKTDYIDIYLLHRDDTSVSAGAIIEIFNALHAEGKIGAFGGSNWTHERIMEANEYAYKHNLIPFEVSSPNFGLAEQIDDLWGGGCVTISGKENAAARAWYQKNDMPVIAYSSLGRGFFSGKLKSTDTENKAGVLDEFALKGYSCKENFERLRRCEILAKEKNMSVSQIAMSWIFHQNMNVFAVVSTSKPERMQENIDALNLELAEQEYKWLNLECDER